MNVIYGTFMLRECFSAITKVIFHKNDEVDIAFYGNLQSFRALVRRFPSNIHVYSLSYWPELRYRQGLRHGPGPESRPLWLPELGSGLWPIPESELRLRLRMTKLYQQNLVVCHFVTTLRKIHVSGGRTNGPTGRWKFQLF